MHLKSTIVFKEGDEVVLARGSNQGTPGIFLRVRTDPKWADIMHDSGVVKMHPVEWLDHKNHGPESLTPTKL